MTANTEAKAFLSEETAKNFSNLSSKVITLVQLDHRKLLFSWKLLEPAKAGSAEGTDIPGSFRGTGD